MTAQQSVTVSDSSPPQSEKHVDGVSKKHQEPHIIVNDGSCPQSKNGVSPITPPQPSVIVDDGSPSQSFEKENEKEEEIVPFEILDLIAQTWRRIKDNVPWYIDHYKKKSERITCGDANGVGDVGSGNRKNIRIFISSTFTDFFAEREVIVKKVCPYKCLRSISTSLSYT